jgi:Glyoxalase-like domain
VTAADPSLPRIRQVVLAARDLDAVAAQLRAELGLGEPFADPGVDYFGLRNAVFALGDTFIEVVSPIRDGTAAGRLLERRGGDCGYMVMFQVPDFGAARARVAAAGVREVFEVALDDIEEVHLHPADMRGAIVSLSAPRPPSAWRWGGPQWTDRSVPGQVAGIRVAVGDLDAVAQRWRRVVGNLPGVQFDRDERDAGLIEVSVIVAGSARNAVEIAGVRFTPLQSAARVG